MIWLVSYPRSGNTFLRNVLYEVYGIPSATFHLESHGPDKNWDEFQVVKTHLLPHQLPEGKTRKVVYLIRDGRDAVVSLANHRSDVISPGTGFEDNLREAIYAAEGSHFGGWSHHVESWVPRADIIIRFEDLVADPIAQCERLRDFLELPEPVREKLPVFETLKNGRPEYGSGKHTQNDRLAAKWFRKGKVNGWKDEMPSAATKLFWHLHGETMEVVGYGLEGETDNTFELLGMDFRCKAGLEEKREYEQVKVLVEAAKLSEPFVDGIKRYVQALLQKMQQWPVEFIQVSVTVNGKILHLEEALRQESKPYRPVHGTWSLLKQVARLVLPNFIYNTLARNISLLKLRSGFSQADNGSKEITNTGFDLLHLTLPQHFASFRTWQKPVVTTIHDMTHVSHPVTHEVNNIRLAAEGLQWSVSAMASFITVSQNTQRDFEKCFPVSQARVVMEGVDRRVFHPVHNPHLLALVRERYGLPEKPFLLSVSTLEPRKNLARVIEAYSMLPESLRSEFHLVLAGRKGWKWNGIKIPGQCRQQVHFTGFIREDHLPALYTLAHGFCYLSLYEGFGLPVLEAMACRCPVLVSNNSSLPELVGNAGLCVSPLDTEGITSAMQRLLTDPALREKLAMECQRQSWNFTWARCLEETFRFYLDVAEQTNMSAQKMKRTSSQTAGQSSFL